MRETLASLARRRWLVVLGVLVSVSIGVLGARLTPPSFEARASIVLLPGPGSIPDAGNPFLYMSGTVPVTEVLSRNMMADATRTRLLGDRADVEYDVYPDASTAGPMIEVTVTARSEPEALEWSERVLAELPQALDRLQEQTDVPEIARISAMTVSIPETATELRSATTRILILLVGVGLISTVLLAIWVDSQLRQNRRTPDGATPTNDP
ncbi:hypothetical protein GCM10009583_31510 [Ornithinicoccus hortensis]